MELIKLTEEAKKLDKYDLETLENYIKTYNNCEKESYKKSTSKIAFHLLQELRESYSYKIGDSFSSECYEYYEELILTAKRKKLYIEYIKQYDLAFNAKNKTNLELRDIFMTSWNKNK